MKRKLPLKESLRFQLSNTRDKQFFVLLHYNILSRNSQHQYFNRPKKAEGGEGYNFHVMTTAQQ